MIALSVVVCIASAVLLAACNDASATALPTDSTAWTFDSLVVTENGQSVTYSVALSEQRYAETGEYIKFDIRISIKKAWTLRRIWSRCGSAPARW